MTSFLFHLSNFFLQFTELSSQAGRPGRLRVGHVGVLPNYQHPPFTLFPYHETLQINGLRKLTNEGYLPLDENTTLVARDHIVIGWKNEGIIQPLYDFQGRMVVFFLETQETVPKSFLYLQRKGVFGLLPNHPQ